MTRIYLQRKFPTLRDHIIEKTYQNLSKLSQKIFHCFYLKIKKEILISYTIQQAFTKHIQFYKHIFCCVMSLYLNSRMRYFLSSSICIFVPLATQEWQKQKLVYYIDTVAKVCNKYLQKILCLLCKSMSSQEEHNKLTDEEKFKLIEFYRENSEL